MTLKQMKMKKMLALGSCIVMSVSAFAQKSAVMEVLNKYNIDAIVLDPNLKVNSDNYYYDLTSTMVTGDKVKNFVSYYDPSKKGDDRWVLVSVNGKGASSSDEKIFEKQHAIVNNFKADDHSYKVVKDDGGYVEITYQYDPASLNKDNGFLKDCVIKLVVNTQTGRLERAEEENLKELKIKILKVTKLNSATHFMYVEKEQKYLVQKEDVAMIIKMLGQEVPTTTVNTYNYKLN